MINHQFHTDSSKYNNLGYDMIIGQDLMKKPGMIVNFKNEYLIWDYIIIPMWRDGANIPKHSLNRFKIK